MKDEKSLEPGKSRTSPAAETSDPPAAAFLERRPLQQEGSLACPVNGYYSFWGKGKSHPRSITKLSRLAW
jgi:hypothetical protein